MAFNQPREFADLPTDMTTLEVDPMRTAAAAVDLLIDLIEGQVPEQRQVLIPTRLVPRASTDRRSPAGGA